MDTTKNAIEVTNLVKRYKELVALDHFNLTVKTGEIFGLLGPNGSGKTTTINCILSLLTYDKGDIKVFGQEMYSNSYDIKREIGVVMQNVAVYDELTYNNVEIPIDRHGEGFKLITRIQDEAHRFAIEFHRSLRSKSQVHSVLDDIEGIGPARRKALMRRYQSLEKIKEADVEDLMQTETMNEKAAQAVYAFFHSAT